MAGDWERTRAPGIYKQDGSRGTKYKATYRDSGGRSHSKTFERVNDAENFLADVRIKKLIGALPDAAAGKMLLRDFWEHFLATSPHLKPSTRALYEMQARLYVLPELGERRLASIAKADIRRLFADMSSAGKGPATISGTQRLLHRLLALAVDEDRIARNPVHGVKVERGQQREARFLNEDEVQRIADEVPGPYRALVFAMSFAGLRIGEAAALRMRNLDLKTGTIRVVENSAVVNGRRVLGSPKTERSIRTVDIGPGLVAILKEHVATFGAPLDPDALVFPNPRGDPVMQSNFRRVFQSAAKRAGIKPTPRVHDMRHTAASFMSRAGYSLVEAGQQLGHSTVGMTAAYSHVFKEHRQQKVSALDAILTGTP